MTNCVRLDLRLNGCFKSWGNDNSKPVGINLMQFNTFTFTTN